MNKGLYHWKYLEEMGQEHVNGYELKTVVTLQSLSLPLKRQATGDDFIWDNLIRGVIEKFVSFFFFDTEKSTDFK